MTGNMRDDILKVLLDEDEIAAKVRELGAKISADYAGKKPIIVGVLKGCYVFMSDLVRCIDVPCTMDFMAASSYGSGTNTSGIVTITKDLTQDVSGRDVILVEDILDSGVTLSHLKAVLTDRRPASIKIATLLDKPARRKKDIKADYCAFTVPDEFVVGYGLDYAEEYRNLPYIGVLKPEIYSK